MQRNNASLGTRPKAGAREKTHPYFPPHSPLISHPHLSLAKSNEKSAGRAHAMSSWDTQSCGTDRPQRRHGKEEHMLENDEWNLDLYAGSGFKAQCINWYCHY